MMEIEKPRIDTVQLTADGTYGINSGLFNLHHLKAPFLRINKF